MLTSQTTGNKLNEQYTYYLNGNQKTKTSNGETTNYIYDGMNRLVRENDTSYTFDDFGNRLTMSDGTATTAYTYDLNNRLITSTETNNGAIKNTRYSYDYNGNQISRLVTSTKALEQGKGETVKISDKTDENVAFYEYNCYNQVIEADTNGVKSSYAYSPDGLRQSKTVDGNTITFVYDNANVVEEITQDGTNKYYRGFEIVKNDDNVYYLYNGQGDVAMLIDNTGETVANYSFDAYGNQSEENTIYNPFGYRGEYQDNETGLIYLRNRYYDSNNGRFITEDTYWNTSNMIYGDKEYEVGETKIPDINAIHQSNNLYVYCISNPIKWFDLYGNAVSSWDKNVLPDSFVSKLYEYTSKWNYSSKEQQEKMRKDAERMRAMYRNKDEYTDEYGITRSVASNREILFATNSTEFSTSTIYVKVGYIINDKNKIELTSRQSTYLHDTDMYVDTNIDEQCFFTNGETISYTIAISSTIEATMPIFEFLKWDIKAKGCKIKGTMYNLK